MNWNQILVFIPFVVLCLVALRDSIVHILPRQLVQFISLKYFIKFSFPMMVEFSNAVDPKLSCLPAVMLLILKYFCSLKHLQWCESFRHEYVGLEH